MPPKRKNKKSKAKKGNTTKFTITDIVKKTVTRMAEKKIQKGAVIVFPEFLNGTSTSTLNSNVFGLAPNNTNFIITQGAGQGQRVGNAITVKRALLRYAMAPDEYSVTFNPTPTPVIVKLWFFRSKARPSELPVLADIVGVASNFFQDGNASQGFSGGPDDLVRSINKDVYTLLGTKTFKIGNKSTVNPSNPGILDNQNFGNNDYKLSAYGTLDITKYFPKNITFNDGNNIPTSNNVIMLLQVTRGDLVTITSLRQPLFLNFTSEIEYTDM